MKIILATWNPDKSIWLSKGFSNLNIPVVIIDPARLVEVEETGSTCEENALLKVNPVDVKENEIIIGEDSGLFTDALDGFPGVKTLRWAEGDDDDRSRKLLEMMIAIPEDNRSAYFKSSVAVKFPDYHTAVFSGVMKGKISDKFFGAKGKGYRNIFILENGKYISESGSDAVMVNDHRYIAMQKASQEIDNWIRNKPNGHSHK